MKWKARLYNIGLIVNVTILRGLLTVQVNKVKKNNIETKSDNVLTVENRIWSLTALDKVIIPSVETAVRSIIGSTGHGLKTVIQNPDRRDFLWNTGDTPLMSASSRLDLSTNQDRNDETCDEKNLVDIDFPTLRPNYDPRAHIYHSRRGRCAGTQPCSQLVDPKTTRTLITSQ